jgi:hypothetical protein
MSSVVSVEFIESLPHLAEIDVESLVIPVNLKSNSAWLHGHPLMGAFSLCYYCHKLE